MKKYNYNYNYNSNNNKMIKISIIINKANSNIELTWPFVRGDIIKFDDWIRYQRNE